MSTYTEQDCLNKITEIDVSRDECIRVLNEKNLEVPDNTKLADLPDYIHNIVEGNFTTLTTTAKFTYGEERAFTCPDNYDGYTTATITFSISDERVIFWSRGTYTDSRNYYLTSDSGRRNHISISAGNNYFPANTTEIVIYTTISLTDYYCKPTNRTYRHTSQGAYDGKIENHFIITN